MADELDAANANNQLPDPGVESTPEVKPADSGSDPKTASLQPEIDAESIGALDDLLKATTGEEGADPDPAKEDEPAAEPKGEEDEPAAEPKGEEDDAAAAAAAAETPDELDTIALPPHTSPKAGDSFNRLKELSKERISERDEKIKTLEQQLQETQAKAETPKEVEKELEDLRKLRASIEIERDPQFKKKFEDASAQASEDILGILKEGGLSDAVIEQARKLGVDKVSNWDEVFERVGPNQRRKIEARLNDIDRLAREKSAALAEAKENVDGYLKQRSEGDEARVKEEAQILESTANEMLAEMPWLSKREIPKGAKPEEVKALQAENKEVETYMGQIQGLLKDSSARTRAIMAVGTVQAIYLRGRLLAHKTEHEKLQKDYASLEARLKKIQKSTSSNRGGSAPAGSLPSRAPALDEDPESALDRLRAEVAAD